MEGNTYSIEASMELFILYGHCDGIISKTYIRLIKCIPIYNQWTRESLYDYKVISSVIR